jgi:outer membrane protein
MMRRASSVIGTILILALAMTVGTVASAEDENWLVRTRLIYISPNDSADGPVGEALDAQVESDFTVEVDLSYFFNDRFAIEGILATAAQEVTIGGFGDRVSLGSVYHAPATFLAQYHFGTEGAFKPYIGLGVNFTIFYSESGDLTQLDLDSNSIGLAGQIGFDRAIGDRGVFNVDLKYIQIETDVGAGGDSLGSIAVDPLVLGVGFGFRF